MGAKNGAKLRNDNSNRVSIKDIAIETSLQLCATPTFIDHSKNGQITSGAVPTTTIWMDKT